MIEPAEPVLESLSLHLSPIMARAVLAVSLSRTGARLERLRPADRLPLEQALGRALKLYIDDPIRLRHCMGDVSRALSARIMEASAAGQPGEEDAGGGRPAPSSRRSQEQALAGAPAPIVELPDARQEPSPSSAQSRLRMSVQIRDENDVVVARGRGREMCERLGFSASIQVKVATAISELARNIVQYAGRGEITMTAVLGEIPGFEVIAEDRGPGIPNLALVMSNDYRSKRGLGIGLKGTRKLMDAFEITSRPGEGTRVRVCKYLR